jgi:hypothetical protein
MDSVLDGNGRNPGPMDRRAQPFSFRVFTNGDNDAAYDLLAAQMAPGVPQRLVYQTDSGALWYTVGSNPRIQHTLAAANSWGAGGYVDFTVTWRIRPDWRPRFSQASDIWGTNDGIWGVSDGIWGSAFTVTLSSNPCSFTLDATGVAGSTLPTIPDTAPTITITGPFGGTGGIGLYNLSAYFRFTDGSLQPYQLILPYQCPSAHDTYALNLASQTFLFNGVPFRPQRPLGQPYWWIVKPGIVNNCTIQAAGGGALTGGSVAIDWWKKRG